MFSMFKSYSQRNSRCKDFKVKNALQICVLIGVCIWLVYLAQHSRQKKTSYDEDTKTSNEAVKLGRRDLDHNVEQSSIIDTKHKEEEDEENKYEEQNKTHNVNIAEEEVLTQKNEQNDNEEKSEHRKDLMNQDNEESVVTNKEMEENEHKDNKEGGNQSEEISEEKNELEKEEAREIEKDDRESEEINQSKIEAKENELENHKQDNQEDRSATENEGEENDEIQVVDSSKNSIQDQDKERNNIEDARDIEVAHLHQNNTVLNVTITNQGNASENQIKQEQEHHNTPSSDVETFRLQNETGTTSNTTEKQFEISKKSNVENSNLHNTTLKMNFSNTDVAVEHVNSTLTNSSEAHERNVLDGQYNNKANANENIHDGPTNASDTSILEDTSSKNKDDVGQVENENIDTRENEDGAQNELVESQTEKENSKQH